MTQSAALHPGHPVVLRTLKYVTQSQGGRISVVVKDRRRDKYFRFGEIEAWLMQRMDGSRSLRRLAEELESEQGIRSGVDALDAFYRRLRELGLVERSMEERSVLVLEALRKQRQSRLKHPGNTLLRMRFTLGDPDRLFDRIIDRIRFFWSPGFVIVSVAAFVFLGVTVVAFGDTYRTGIGSLLDPANFSLGYVLTLYGILTASVLVHELGHGLTCKHFGGEVNDMGVMVMYLQPAAYANVNDAWLFERKSQRLWVTFSGGWIQMLVAAFAALAWLALEPGTWGHQAAFIFVVLGFFVLPFNYNPLLPLDGYYALMDWLEIPNLRPRSFAYTAAHLKRRLHLSDAALPAVTDRERRIFLAYGWAAIAYSTLFLGTAVMGIGAFLAQRMGWWGWALLVFLALVVLRKRLVNLGRAMVGSITSGRFTADRLRRPAGFIAATLGGLALVLMLVPWDIRVTGDADVEPLRRSWIRAAEEGWVDRIVAGESTRVQSGDTLAILRNPEIELAWSAAESALRLAEGELLAARAAGHTRRIGVAEQRAHTARAEFLEWDRRRAALVLLAPFSGEVVTPRTHELAGARAQAGDSLLELWNAEALRVRISVAQRDAGGIEVGSPVRMKFPAEPSVTWWTSVDQVGPAANAERLDVLATLAPEESDRHAFAVKPGMRGKARITIRKSTVGGRLLHWLRHSIRRDWLL